MAVLARGMETQGKGRSCIKRCTPPVYHVPDSANTDPRRSRAEIVRLRADSKESCGMPRVVLGMCACHSRVPPKLTIETT